MAMSPAKRKKHIEDLKDVLESFGFKADSYGNYLYPRIKDYRVKFKTNNVICQRKVLGTWVSANYSKVISQISVDEFEKDIRARRDMILKMHSIDKEEKKPKVTKIPLIPVQDNPDAVAEIHRLSNERNHADYQCYMVLKQLYDSGLLPSTEIVGADFTEDEIELLESIKPTLDHRIEVNDQLLRKMSGR